jgi:acetyl coenzyme A synthetase (ADP forming)-like protein
MGTTLIPGSDVVLRDGSLVWFREQGPEDSGAILELLQNLSPTSRAFRFLSAGVDLSAASRVLSRVDGIDAVGLVAVHGQPERVVGQAMFIRTGPSRAEVAFTVADSFQDEGMGSILLGQLAQTASASGIGMFEATVHPENSAMLSVFSESGFAVRTTSEPGLVRIEFPTELTTEALQRFEDREEAASAAAVRALLNPRTVAVIGASRHRGTIGGEVFHNLLTGEFQGTLYPVHSGADVVQAVHAYRHVADVDDSIDLAIVMVPAEVVVPVARECAAKGVRALVVISSGFAEVGDEGRRRQAELVEICSASGMRLVGPNCMGIINTDPGVRINATFGPTPPDPGPIGFLSQSGALGLAIIDATRKLGLGMSSFVSVGNKSDISGNDLLSFWESDPRTEVLGLYLESFGNPRKFARIAGRISRKKPIVMVKSGTGVAGQRAAASHTAALVSANDAAVSALLEKTGVIRAQSLGEMFDLLTLLSTQPLPQGNRVGIITNAGGPGILCADACESSGLEVAEFGLETQRQLTALLSSHASVRNPVDMTASASAEYYGSATKIVAADTSVDAVIVIFIPPMVTKAEDVVHALASVGGEMSRAIPLIGVFMADSGISGCAGTTIPTFPLPEDAVRALAGAQRLSKWRSHPRPSTESPAGIDPVAVASQVARSLREKRAWLTGAETESILRAYGVPVLRSQEADSPAAAAEVARQLGGRVVLKGIGPGILHKSELGAVLVGLEADYGVEQAAQQMMARLSHSPTPITRFELQPVAPAGVEVLVGATNDPDYGTLVVVAAGGTAVELLRDSSVRLGPIGMRDADDMLRQLRTFLLLDGFRGAPKIDLGALCDVICRLAALAQDHTAIAELEANPVIASPTGSLAVDVRIRIGPPTAPALIGAKRVH